MVPSTAAGSFRIFTPPSKSMNTIINALITASHPLHGLPGRPVCVPDGMSFYFKYLGYEI
jgi:hypothetical protein